MIRPIGFHRKTIRIKQKPQTVHVTLREIHKKAINLAYIRSEKGQRGTKVAAQAFTSLTDKPENEMQGRKEN